MTNNNNRIPSSPIDGVVRGDQIDYIWHQEQVQKMNRLAKQAAARRKNQIKYDAWEQLNEEQLNEQGNSH